MRPTNNRGFTLVEALVATFLTVVVGATVTKSMVFTTNVVGENTLQGEAISLAQEALEDLRTIPYEEIVSGSESAANDLFTIEREVEADTPEEGMKEITVTVSWEWKGEERTYALHTVYSKINKT
jgi:type II secretory pathway pseudopilin PulG